MTLQLALLIIVSCAAAALAGLQWYAYACADLDRLRQQEHWAARFARGARLLMEDDRVPQPLLITLSQLNHFLLDRDACMVLYHVFTEPRSRRGVASTEEADFYEAYPELAKALSETLFAALMAITYSNVRWGERTRGAMARLYRGEARVTELASDAAREVTRGDHHLPPGLLPA